MSYREDGASLTSQHESLFILLPVALLQHGRQLLHLRGTLQILLVPLQGSLQFHSQGAVLAPQLGCGGKEKSGRLNFMADTTMTVQAAESGYMYQSTVLWMFGIWV